MDLLQDWKKSFLGKNDAADDVAKEQAETHRARVAGLKDPFTPLGAGDPAARAKERILWEDTHFMVVQDLFARAPKGLVVPKREMFFPTDATAEELQRLNQITAALQTAFEAEGAPSVRAWINPPTALMIRQLHVHVQPGFAILPPERKEEVLNAVEKHLQETLG